MARLITKFKYLKPDERNHFGGYAEYIATREGVEKIDESKRNASATNKQKQLIKKILSDFPDSKSSLEYEDYLNDKTVGAASEFITRVLEENADEMMHTKTYADYIATRPRAERIGSHGLFTDDGVAVDLQKVSDELNAHTGNVWTAIVSLRREDAERLGFDNGSRWRDMLRSQAQTLSENLRIPMSNLRWFAAFHNESHHPHIHLIAYSTDPNEGYLSEKGVMALRSAFAKDIFAQDLLCEYKKQTEHRDALKMQSCEVLAEIMAKINGGTYNNPTVENLLQTLSKRLAVTNGKKQYGYLRKDIKEIIDSIVDEIGNDERIAALYCRVSTKQDEQLNSYEVQRTHYEERIRTEPKWSLVGIFADKGITGTSMKKRDEFNKMLRLCYKGKIDMIIVKSISRFARNTLDVIKITRKLREINVDVFFEEQGIHSIDPASEFYITIYGSIAQSESENISANVKWGKAQSAKQGNVPFQCKHFLGYTKNADGEIEIVPDEAEIIREIYEQYLSGESLYGIKCYLEAKEIPTPAGCSVWRQETIRSILSNEKYKGDAIINKTYVSDCISKRIKANNGERNKYYIENNHPAIIDAGTFARVQEEIARRSGKPKVKQKGTKTELSRYSSRYALSELLICGECRTPYRRCTWTAKGKRKIVWRCINRLDYGKKYCHHSPSIEESLLQDAVMRAIMQTAKQNIEVLKTLKIHVGMGLTDEVTEDKTLDIQIRIAEIAAEFQKMLKGVSADNADGIDEERITELMNEKQRLTVQLEQYAAVRQKRESAKARLDEIFTILDGLQNHPMEYDDKLVRQIIECIVVESKEKIKVVFIGGTEIEMTL